MEININIGAIPQEMKALKNWVLWRYETQDSRTVKIPLQKNGKRAKTTDPKTWGTLPEIQKALEGGWADGIGFVFSRDTGIMGLDFDHVRNPETGEWDQEALEEILSLSSYAELSPSGAGAHVICFAKVLGTSNRGKNINREMYDQKRYFTVTGNWIKESPAQLMPAQSEVNELSNKWFSPKTNNTKTRAKRQYRRGSEKRTRSKVDPHSQKHEMNLLFQSKGFQDVFLHGKVTKSQSEADFALCAMVARVNPNPTVIETIWRNSRIWRKKCERGDYVERTISAAIEKVRT